MTDSNKSVDEKSTPVIQRVSPRTIPGVLSSANKGAIDWGWQTFVAYGCHNHVVIVDTRNVKVFQTLEKHTSDVIKVKWAHEKYYHDLENSYMLRLASCDISGLVAIWDVKEGKTISTLSEPGKSVADIEWVHGKDNCQHLLVGLYPPYSIIMWNTEKGSKIWKKSYNETLLSFTFDPFCNDNVAFLATDCILFVDDFSVRKAPVSNGRKFCVSSPIIGNSSTSASSQSLDEKDKTTSRSAIAKRMRLLVKADSKHGDENVALNECLQLMYHRSYRHHLLLLYPREILILDLEINQTVGIVSVEHTAPPMMQLHSCYQRDAFFILHESGGITFRIRHQGSTLLPIATPSECFDTGVNASDTNLEVLYDSQCQSDALRLTKHAKATGMAICPTSENMVALLVSDGRVLFLSLTTIHKEKLNFFPPNLSSIISYGMFFKEDEKLFQKLEFIIHPEGNLADSVSPALYPAWSATADCKDHVKFKMYVQGNFTSLAAPPYVLRMCPPVTFRNWMVYRPFMAVGNTSGTVQIINMATGVIEKEYALHTSPVRGIEWIGLTSFLSYSHPNTVNNAGHVRNELVIAELQSGRTKHLRPDRTEEPPIEMIRVSYLRQYVIVVFKEGPFEIWDLRQLALLRVMPKNFPVVTALEWSPGHYKRTQSSLDLIFDKGKDALTPTLEYPAENDVAMKNASYTKEHLVFTNTNGLLYHFSVEGNVFKHGSVIPAETMGSVTCIAWKGDHIVLGDVDGNLNVWNLKGKISKVITTHRGWIKKMRFGPGKGNMKILVLYNDGADIYDIKEVSFVQQVRCPKEMPKVQDVEWASSDRPVLATADGCIRIVDLTLKQCSSPINDYQPSDFPFSPHVLPAEISFSIKCYLHHINHEPNCMHEMDLNLDDTFKKFLILSPFGTAERCLHVSRIFGDEESLLFWTVALHFLKRAKYNNSQNKTGDLDDEFLSYPEYFCDHPLDTSFDILCDNETYKKLQLDRVKLHASKRTTYLQTQKCAERLLLLGKTDQAVQLLLETEAENENFYEDCLRACLIATVQSSGTSQSIIKLVSTNLIASGRVSQGVQLLCLIDKAGDACRYLQGASCWDDAVWLAKATLPEKDSHEILKRWVDHLCSPFVNQKDLALLVLLSMNEFWKVVSFCHLNQMTERAALFLEACIEFRLVNKTSQNSDEINSIFMDYSRYLLSVENRTSAVRYCKLASCNEKELRDQCRLLPVCEKDKI